MSAILCQRRAPSRGQRKASKASGRTAARPPPPPINGGDASQTGVKGRAERLAAWDGIPSQPRRSPVADLLRHWRNTPRFILFTNTCTCAPSRTCSSILTYATHTAHKHTHIKNARPPGRTFLRNLSRGRNGMPSLMSQLLVPRHLHAARASSLSLTSASASSLGAARHQRSLGRPVTARRSERASGVTPATRGRGGPSGAECQRWHRAPRRERSWRLLLADRFVTWQSA